MAGQSSAIIIYFVGFKKEKESVAALLLRINYLGCLFNYLTRVPTAFSAAW